VGEGLRSMSLRLEFSGEVVDEEVSWLLATVCERCATKSSCPQGDIEKRTGLFVLYSR